ncbi:hypothetical protein PGT21_028647 [Puccinia graminis f. sp. tritici]|uniref:Uncharacterized protein n=1 Tax=Puccinia graminis f. sp. tritici TaxID=56615 RepID=A0A5B0RS60_PUCGR|nr:hypothetical protein PGT21_028647 [Puccinia graminis f. sp. tritici]KAA1128142.1 hypothetical protein PGTUg99_015529 [Puccinia graminis f. sp. tritici]
MELITPRRICVRLALPNGPNGGFLGTGLKGSIPLPGRRRVSPDGNIESSPPVRGTEPRVQAWPKVALERRRKGPYYLPVARCIVKHGVSTVDRSGSHTGQDTNPLHSHSGGSASGAMRVIVWAHNIHRYTDYSTLPGSRTGRKSKLIVRSWSSSSEKNVVNRRLRNLKGRWMGT